VFYLVLVIFSYIPLKNVYFPFNHHLRCYMDIILVPDIAVDVAVAIDIDIAIAII
jgi:hypothetical protein